MEHVVTSNAGATINCVGHVNVVHAPYISVRDADAYFDMKLDNELWYTTNNDKQLRALNTATRYIECLNFSGDKSVATQRLEFPRNGGTVIPDDVKYACCEVAYNLLDERDPEFESEHVHIGMSNIGTVKTNKDTENVPVHILHNIPSSLAWAYLRPYLADTNTLQMQRMS